ncbi:hypothetical protein ACM01_41125 [Streptomyces viridochromogenes]|uniref:Integral membrane protein n=1 Tax=Streptomyces viridochromogenes TaxID=1938 RepID=A0A0J7YWM2_STRVR|nr:hypothetical protein [Streptomyces viridochromogenes]KMS67882.1 hypothetical protein ACM01_41125 [Streptomyces viridochromogenes]KOG20285.1 hypothetical protein ADK35_18755 [Streptomyces viridochromogenes]KOG21617.1 hypothetical protein ADK36_14380 [Streptomyces viridochromogenes]
MSFTPQQLRDADRRTRELSSPERQLQAALHQAEGYRNFLAALTGLLTAVFVLKGQEDLSKLAHTPRWLVIGLLVTGFLALIAASWLGVLAVHGRPGEEIMLEAGRLLEYEKQRTRVIWRLVEWARWFGLLGVLAVSSAVIVTWVWPGKK